MPAISTLPALGSKTNLANNRTGFVMGDLLNYEIHLKDSAAFADGRFTPEGTMISNSIWRQNKDSWLPTEEDFAYVSSLMQPVTEPGKMANWIAPPARGIDGKPKDFEYVRLA